ncbi:hypothetical protein F5883DRAFT_673874 [Diaporthe sp. PMI_573]|nr:hypothetical protein F5883DRAFT_673874 [Diaporthaceae sp. PMI_573]
MLPQVVVAIVALLLTTLATAIAVWECARKPKHIAAPELSRRESPGDDIRLDGQGVPHSLNNANGADSVSSHGGHTGHKTNVSQTASRDVESEEQVDSNGNIAPTEVEDRYSNAV